MQLVASHHAPASVLRAPLQVLHKGSDGRENQWEDLILLNYRKLEAWDRTIAELNELAMTYGVRGAFVHDAQVRAASDSRFSPVQLHALFCVCMGSRGH